ncbi:MAG TPA: AEC family transporter [Candidatus Ornithomonoglobus merdipullorum]|uniref:AEC family transporter n=1 Tax=Candidatus Ornithomonoglobus merdipullorum TaxID=2840895 RepID=A0A9D1MA93_9FIRM|nr:AEC family transporter [Candidatus Ornithomonoglobus merdipullorum]
MDIKTLITSMVELFIIIFVGYFIYKAKIVDDNFTKKFTKLVLDVTLPAMILASVLTLEERQELYDVITAIAVAAALFFVVLPGIGFFLAKLIRAKKEQIGLYTFMNAYSNVGFMGFPVIEGLCGSVGLFYAAIFNLIFNLSTYTLGIWMMNKGREDAEKFNVKRLLSPGVLLSALSIVIYFLDIKFPTVITETIESIGSITSPAAMLLIGCSLAKMDIKSVFTEVRIYPWTIIKQLIIPLLLWFPLTMIIKNELVLNVTYVLIAMPVANSAVLFATNYGGDSELAAKTTFITTLISLITVPICILAVQ